MELEPLVDPELIELDDVELAGLDDPAGTPEKRHSYDNMNRATNMPLRLQHCMI